MNLFTLLRHHAQTRPETIAVAAHGRGTRSYSTTYRRFWSRIERASARLQGEWHIRPDDTVAYWGCGHPDALTLYFALARCGARLLPLEHVAVQRDYATILHECEVKMVLHDDDALFDPAGVVSHCAPLSSLIARRCPHQSSAIEDVTRPSLIALQPQADRSWHRTVCSLAELMTQPQSAPGELHAIAHALFDTEIFAPVVLTTLIAGETLRFN